MSFRYPRPVPIHVIPIPAASSHPCHSNVRHSLCHSDDRREEESLRPIPADGTCSAELRFPVFPRFLTAFEMTPGDVIPTSATPFVIPTTVPPQCHSDDRREEESLRPIPAGRTCSAELCFPVSPRFLTAFEMTPGDVIPTSATPFVIPTTVPPQCHSDDRREEESLRPIPSGRTCPLNSASRFLKDASLRSA